MTEEDKLVTKERYTQLKKEYDDLQKRLHKINLELASGDVSYSKKQQFLEVSSKINSVSLSLETLLKSI